MITTKTRKTIFATIGGLSAFSIIWVSAVALNDLDNIFTVVFLSSLALLDMYISYRLYQLTAGKKTKIIVGAIAIKVALVGFTLAIPVNWLLNFSLISLSVKIYITAWALLAIGTFVAALIYSANRRSIDSLCRQLCKFKLDEKP